MSGILGHGRLTGICGGAIRKFYMQGRDQCKDFGVAQFRQQFHDAVVAPVQATYLMFPDSHASI